MSTRNHSTSAIEPVGGTRVVESSSARVKLHVLGIDARTVNPWVVDVVLSTLDTQDLELVVKVG